MTSCHTRPPAVAGSFYPADPRRLRTEVAIVLANAAIETPSSPPRAYSGPIAAAFATVRERAEAVTRIVMIGPAHHTWVPGIAVPTVMAFETPLGSVAVDQAALATISDLPFVLHDDAVHVSEHALEVELPFLQSTIGAFVLVPLLVGDATPQQVALILDRLWGWTGDSDRRQLRLVALSGLRCGAAARCRDRSRDRTGRLGRPWS